MNPHITPAALAELQAAGAPLSLLDVRTPAEFEELHVAFARNVPLETLRPESFGHGMPLYVICRSGSRASDACNRLRAAGLNAVNVEGGMRAWEKAGLPVARGGSSAISLERQVRIAAGLLVLAGVLLGATVDSLFYGLTAFVGAGLIFAGVTDSCGMSLLLARMPWNRRVPPANASCALR